MSTFVLLTVTSIIFVVDPLGVLPSYLVMTAADRPDKRRRTALRAAVAATVTLLLFAAGGGHMVKLFGVTMPALRIAGGLVLLIVALDMTKALRPTQEGPGEVAEGSEKADVAITPLAIPMLAGPAALATVTMLMNQAETWPEAVVVIAVILLTGSIIYITLRLAEPLHRLLGKTGIQVLTRIMGLVLLALAVQFILDGWQQYSAAASTRGA
ncbi:MAG TPA: NAAT family transporter [Planctomycetes bacterium]|nr:NAAT family transporter [Planctomycetota bacterium]